MKKGVIITALLIFVFLAGWQSQSLYSAIQNFDLETPVSQAVFSRDKISPHDWIERNQIHVYSDKVVLDIPNVVWAEIADTKSMDPVFDSTAHVLQLIPTSPNDIHVGDIVSYEYLSDQPNIIHRVVEIGNDAQGWYAVIKGDNNSSPDPGKVRFDQIRKVMIGVIY